MSDPKIKLSQKSHNDLCILTLHEKSLDTDKAPVLKTELLRLLAGGAKHFLINMSEVDTIDNSGLGALTFGKRQLDDTGGQFSLCCLCDGVFSFLRIANLGRVFPVYDTEEMAVKEMRCE